jgi:hypothetical protein
MSDNNKEDGINKDDINIEIPKVELNKQNDNENKKLESGVEAPNDKTDNDIKPIPLPKFKVPPALWRTFICSLSLFAIGATLIGIGFIDSVAAADPGKGITFWTIGSIVLIPGGYYSYKFFKAKRAKTEDERQEIYDQIPEL